MTRELHEISVSAIEAAASVLGAYAWPLLILISLTLFRHQIRDLLARLVRIDVAGAKFEFARQAEHRGQRILRKEPNATGSLTPEQQKAAEEIAGLASTESQQAVRKEMLRVAMEYNRANSIIDQKAKAQAKDRALVEMRLLSLAASNLLDELRLSGSFGERLAAIAILQLRPRPSQEILSWLADQLVLSDDVLVKQASLAIEILIAQAGDLELPGDIDELLDRAEL